MSCGLVLETKVLECRHYSSRLSKRKLE